MTTFTLRYAGQPVNITLTDQDGLVAEDKWLKVINGAPGLGQLEVIVNGAKFKLAAMQNNQEYTLDISSAMRLSGNVVTLTPKGRPGSADISIGN